VKGVAKDTTAGARHDDLWFGPPIAQDPNFNKKLNIADDHQKRADMAVTSRGAKGFRNPFSTI